MKKNKTRYRVLLLGLVGGLPQAGCATFFIRELEALLAPGSPDNALFVLDSILFPLLAPLLLQN